MTRRKLSWFHGFIGQPESIRFLQQQISGAVARNEPVPHTLIVGPSGVGKTLLAKAIAEARRAELVEVPQTVNDSPDGLAELLKKLPECAVVFWDECHRVPAAVQEFLYRAIDLGKIPNVKRPDGAATTDAPTESTLKRFTLVLATDQPDKLLDALQKRMVNNITLRYYKVSELRHIIDQLATERNLLLTPHAANLLARVCRGLPRIARHHLDKLRLHVPQSEGRKLGRSTIAAYLRSNRIDTSGLGVPERRYLAKFRNAERHSLESIALCLGLQAAYVKKQIEPALLHHGLIEIGNGGRKLTPKGRELLTKVCRKATKAKKS